MDLSDSGTKYFVPRYAMIHSGSTTLANMPEPGLSGRRAEAARNDAAILAAARDVFVADPDAPVSEVAERAGVGISSLYRRYRSKEELLRKLCGDGLQLYNEIALGAVEDDDRDPWERFATFMARIIETDVHALTRSLAGRFRPTAELSRAARLADDLNEQIVARAQAAGVLREDVHPDDLTFVFEQVASIHGPTPERTAQLRARYLALQLDGLHTPGRTPLPGPPPTAEEQHARWN
jgi:AcrR family transcriptional regulator